MSINMSVVDIVLNDRFKIFIKQLKRDNEDIINQITNCIGEYDRGQTHTTSNLKYKKHQYYYDLKPFDEATFAYAVLLQKRIRTYIINNQHKLDFKNSRRLKDGRTTSMPNFFLIFACYTLPDIDKLTDFSEIKLKQLFENTLLEPVFAFFNADKDDTQSHCCCSHNCKLKNLYLFEKKISKLRFITGCDCIEKSELIGES